MTTTRFPNGITTAKETAALGDFTLPDPTKAITFFDEFFFYDNAAPGYEVDVTGSNSSLETTDSVGGKVHLETGAVAGQRVFMRTPALNFIIEPGKQTWYKCGFTPQQGLNTEFAFGLQDGSGPDDVFAAGRSGIFFRSLNATFAIDLVSNDGGTETAVEVATSDYTLVETTLGFHYDGDTKITAFVNDVQTASLTAPNLPALSTRIGYVAAVEAGVSVIQDVHLDYVFIAKER